MRVQIVAELAKEACGAPPAENRAVQSFLAAMNSDDSFFQVSACEASLPPSTPQADPHGFVGSFIVGFRADELNRNRGLFFSLLEKLAELLSDAGSADALEARIGLTREAADTGRLRLALQLTANGNSLAQAEMRWALGLVHVQQALLFTSRYFRQQFAARND